MTCKSPLQYQTFFLLHAPHQASPLSSNCWHSWFPPMEPLSSTPCSSGFYNDSFSSITVVLAIRIITTSSSIVATCHQYPQIRQTNKQTKTQNQFTCRCLHLVLNFSSILLHKILLLSLDLLLFLHTTRKNISCSDTTLKQGNSVVLATQLYSKQISTSLLFLQSFT